MKTVIYWKERNHARNKDVKAALGIKYISVNGESEYKGEMDKLVPYINEGVIAIRMKNG